MSARPVLEQARVATTSPVAAFEHMSEIGYGVKISHPFVIGLDAEERPEVLGRSAPTAR
jgi:hypothetical protein